MAGANKQRQTGYDNDSIDVLKTGPNDARERIFSANPNRKLETEEKQNEMGELSAFDNQFRESFILDETAEKSLNYSLDKRSKISQPAKFKLKDYEEGQYLKERFKSNNS